MTHRQVLIISALGGMLGVAGTALFILLCFGVFCAAAHLGKKTDALLERRRALKDGLRRLTTFTTIDDLKD